MQTLSFDVAGMTCGGCGGCGGGCVQRTLGKLDGASNAAVTLSPGVATVTVDPARVTPAQIESALAALGYPAKLRQAAQRDEVRS